VLYQRRLVAGLPRIISLRGMSPMLLMPPTLFFPSICTKRELAPAEFVEPLKIASFETESIFVLHRVKGRYSNLWSQYDLCVVGQRGTLCEAKW